MCLTCWRIFRRRPYPWLSPFPWDLSTWTSSLSHYHLDGRRLGNCHARAGDYGVLTHLCLSNCLLCKLRSAENEVKYSATTFSCCSTSTSLRVICEEKLSHIRWECDKICYVRNLVSRVLSIKRFQWYQQLAIRTSFYDLRFHSREIFHINLKSTRREIASFWPRGY